MRKELNNKESLLRLSDVLEIIPVSKSHWWQGIKDGKFPKAYKLSARVTVWKESDIVATINNLKIEEDGQ